MDHLSKNPNHLRTFTGKYIDIFNPKEEDICIEDIAHALSMIPRWGGHCEVPYSVSEHSIFVSELVKIPELKLPALLHDATEAYLMDMPRPIKWRMQEYKTVEIALGKVIARKFGIECFIGHEEIKRADDEALHTEWVALMVKGSDTLNRLAVPTHAEIKAQFLSTFNSLV